MPILYIQARAASCDSVECTIGSAGTFISAEVRAGMTGVDVLGSLVGFSEGSDNVLLAPLLSAEILTVDGVAVAECEFAFCGLCSVEN